MNTSNKSRNMRNSFTGSLHIGQCRDHSEQDDHAHRHERNRDNNNHDPAEARLSSLYDLGQFQGNVRTRHAVPFPSLDKQPAAAHKPHCAEQGQPGSSSGCKQ